MHITISIVEDDPLIRGILSEWVRAVSGFKCVGVLENAESAPAALPQEKPSVVLMDIYIPGMSGIECVSCLKQEPANAKYLMKYEN